MKHKVQFAGPGFDPTSEDLPADDQTGPKLSGCLLIGGIVALAMLLMGGLGVGVLTQISGQGAEPTALPPADTYTPYPTYTPPPTWTPDTGFELNPDWHPTATLSPVPTLTPTLTATPVPPGMIASWTPGPWLLTRFAEGERKR